ncbi:MAG: hypothetical protein UY07_C0045G0019 [Parcubacteria group bacterium GW2011_GWA1_47_8]|nr:MAG: hypothetical protein UY07_C0045G0019 [Parcubacteria group bacterium GW2011_GWA1_47_8]KKW07978.1 MAG: hypothetical protein UY42_C0002G0027 [Parcubacteria group bacterium GW2011_GWA2_49_16]
MMRPGMPLRIEVKNAIYFGPVNQWTRDIIFPRIGVGIDIAHRLDGYWDKDEQGRVRRVATLGNGRVLEDNDRFLHVTINLAVMKSPEVFELHQILNAGRFLPSLCALKAA